MIQRIKIGFFALIESYIAIAGIALVAGLLFPDQLIKISFLSTFMLQIIFFLSSLKIDLDEVKRSFKDMWSLIIVNMFMLILLPIAVFYIVRIIFPELALPLMLLAAMPAGMTTPLLTEVVKGNVGFSLVLTVSTSLLAPLTIPFVIKILVGTTVDISFVDMFVKLIYVIVVPFILATIVRRFFHAHIKKSYYTFKPISLALLGLLIAVLVAKSAHNILNDINNFVFYLIVTVVFYVILHILGYFLVVWRNRKDRLTIAVSVTYMNFVLAIYLAVLYFDQPEVILPLVISIVPWALMLVPFSKVITIIHKGNSVNN